MGAKQTKVETFTDVESQQIDIKYVNMFKSLSELKLKERNLLINLKDSLLELKENDIIFPKVTSEQNSWMNIGYKRAINDIEQIL